MARKRTQDTARREMELLELRRSGLSYEEISERILNSEGRQVYKDGPSVRARYHQIIGTRTARASEDVLSEELDRLDALWMTMYPKARKGDQAAFDRCMKILERRSRYLGLDHADGISERAVQIEEAKVELLTSAIQAVLSGLNLSPEQQQIAPALVRQHLLALPA